MAIAVVQSKTVSGVSGSILTLTFDSSVTAGNTVVLFGASGLSGSTAPSTFTIGGSGGSESWTKDYEGGGYTGWESFIQARTHNVTGGWTTLTLTIDEGSGGNDYPAATIIEISGINNADPLESQRDAEDAGWDAYPGVTDPYNLGTFPAPAAGPVAYFAATMTPYLYSGTDYFDMSTGTAWTRIDATGTGTDALLRGGGHVQWVRVTDTTVTSNEISIGNVNGVAWGYCFNESTGPTIDDLVLTYEPGSNLKLTWET